MTRAPKVLLFLAAGLALAQPPDNAVHAVLLLEDSPGLRQAYDRLRIPTLRNEDRIAIVTFSRSTKVRSGFTHDRQKLESVVQRMWRSGRVSFHMRPGSSPVRVFRAVQDSCGLFAKLSANQRGKRVVILVFGSDDYSAKPGAAEIRAALEKVHARLFVAPAHLQGFRLPPVPTTPPTFPGSRPGQTEVSPPPDAAIRVLLESGGAVIQDHPDLAAILERARR